MLQKVFASREFLIVSIIYISYKGVRVFIPRSIWGPILGPKIEEKRGEYKIINIAYFKAIPIYETYSDRDYDEGIGPFSGQK
jgi:hypothetical protein